MSYFQNIELVISSNEKAKPSIRSSSMSKNLEPCKSSSSQNF